jgi:hypothetical protein
MDPPGDAEVGATEQRVPAIAFSNSDRVDASGAGDADGEQASLSSREPALRLAQACAGYAMLPTGGTDCHEVIREDRVETMGRQAATVLYVLALIAVVVGVDVLFFRHQFWERLIVNVGIVLVFAAFGLRFLKRA